MPLRLPYLSAEHLYDILRIMRLLKNLIKITVLLALLAALALVSAFYLYKDRLHEEARLYAQKEFSRLLKREVDIGSVGYVPFQSVSFENVSVSEKGDASAAAAAVNSITIELDVLSIVRNKQLKTTVRIEGLNLGRTLCNATLRTVSGKAREYREVFDPFLLETVTVIEAAVSAKDFMLCDIFGILQIDNTDIHSAKVRFSYNDIRYLLDIEAREENVGSYALSLRSDHLGLSCVATKDQASILVDDLRGMFYTLRFDLKGEVRDYLSPDIYASLNGTMKTDLKACSSLPGKIGGFARTHPMSGAIRSNVNFQRLSADPARCEAVATLVAADLKIGKVSLKELTTRISLEDGRLNAPLVNGVFYGGTLSGDLKMDLIEDGMPYMLSLFLNNMDLGRLMRDLKGDKAEVWGDLNADLTLQGYADDSASAEGNGSVTVTKADLGPMPILTPLLGDIYSHLEKMMSWSGKINITQAYADFDIKDRRVSTNDLTFWGEDIYIISEGYMDFDGNLDFSFENQFRDPDPDKEREWTVALRDAIVSFGKKISRAHLGGTISEPEWDFEYINPLTNFLQRNVRNFLDTSE